MHSLCESWQAYAYGTYCNGWHGMAVKLIVEIEMPGSPEIENIFSSYQDPFPARHNVICVSIQRINY